MQNNLLATKLYIPQRPINLVPRLHLLQSLDQGVRMGRRLTIISAPAGYGKTTLLVAWIQERDLPTAWISLDEGDNDVTRFLTYLIAALQKVHADPDDSELFNLQPTQEQPIESVLTAIVNALSRIPDPFLIVLDDYHIIQASAVHVAASFLLEHLPPQAHLVIATRADPPLPLARLRGRGQLTELRMTDLRFTEEEVAKFLNQITSPNLTPEDIVTLSTRTEGLDCWAANGGNILAGTGGHRQLHPSLRWQPPVYPGLFGRRSSPTPTGWCAVLSSTDRYS